MSSLLFLTDDKVVNRCSFRVAMSSISLAFVITIVYGLIHYFIKC